MKRLIDGDRVEILSNLLQDVSTLPVVAGREQYLPLTRRIERGVTLRKIARPTSEETLRHLQKLLAKLLEDFNQSCRSQNLPLLNIERLDHEIEPFFDNPSQLIPDTLAASLGSRKKLHDELRDAFEDLGWRCFYLLSLLPTGCRMSSCVDDAHQLHLSQVEEEYADCRKRLFEGTLRYVFYVSRLYINRNIPYMDVLQEGFLGLSSGIDRFKERKGSHFQAYAALWIRQRIDRYMSTAERLIRVPLHVHENAYQTHRVYSEIIENHYPYPEFELYHRMHWITDEDLAFLTFSGVELERFVRYELVAKVQQLYKHYEAGRHITSGNIPHHLNRFTRRIYIAYFEYVNQNGREPEKLQLLENAGLLTCNEIKLLQSFPEYDCSSWDDEKTYLDSLKLRLRKVAVEMKKYRMVFATHYSLERTRFPTQYSQTSFDDHLCSEFTSEEEGDRAILNQKIDQIFDQLPVRDKAILQLRFGLGDGEERTLEEVGSMLGVTRERIRQIEARVKEAAYRRNRKLRNEDFSLDSHEHTQFQHEKQSQLSRLVDYQDAIRADTGLDIQRQRKAIDNLINQYITGGKKRIVDTRRRGGRIALFKQVLEDAGKPLHYGEIHLQAMELIPSTMHFSKQTTYATLFYTDLFRSMGNSTFGLRIWDHAITDEIGDAILQYCPKPLLQGNDARSFFESIMIGRDMLQRIPNLNARQFYTEMLGWAGQADMNVQDAQAAFDAWYASGLINRIDYVRHPDALLKVTMPQGLQLNEARNYCLSNICCRIIKMPELLLTLETIAYSTVASIQKVLFGSEKAGFDITYRLALFEAFEAIRRDGDTWRLTAPGKSALEANPPLELPDFSEIVVAEDPEEASSEIDWDDLDLLDF